MPHIRYTGYCKGDKYIVNGQKTWTSFAQWANWIFCLIHTDSDANLQKGISLLLISMDIFG
ncbi:hypothetical protein BN2476_10034 [Paraburkholderia piptadeniae]|uniref:Acyl-CoA oxidase/dehydrogenase middle domain-containing protein n=1 Tax=Paraburkholderia piptadeniae TaxID=1701573 RepID=A0A1N7RIN9_9BURK|nr:hypothetical protein BN2476_10034 [Paraburkholderia piptadeniae]